ncbi:hypothetical protein EZS27_035060 [termite gut metagenome]|uniref:AbiEi antitoxin C-terminal domain-containing protein n=1 Tax=termite gut metagenome TaxID=433724 RepID=A0A5J4PXA8_9ZZZZ
MTDTIRDTINTFPCGFVFTPKNFPIDKRKYTSVNRILNNMVAAGQIRRLSKGRFYKSQITESGELLPDTFQTIKDLIEKDGKQIGYITGYSVFNELKLTTQVCNVLQIGTTKGKKAVMRRNYQVRFIKQKNAITKDSVPLLQLLDCLRLFKTIPDTNPNQACTQLLHLLEKLDDKQKSLIKSLALNYTPQAIALLGAMLETINPQEDTNVLLNTLNPQTFYQLGISDMILLNQKKWNIR